MKLASAAGLTALQLVSAHTLFTTLFINDGDQGDGACVRMSMTPNNATFPIVGAPLSMDTACGTGGTAYVNRTCPTPSGAKLTFTFRETPNNPTDGSLDASHLGPCAVYMKNVPSPLVPGNGDSWFKIWDEGYDTETSKWCTEKLIENHGLLSVNIPDTLPGGYYLVRPELISLHQADKNPPDPQFYVGCAQIFLAPPKNGKAGLLPMDMVSIPGYLAADDPGLLYDIYTEKGQYVMPGPPPYTAGQETKLVENVLEQDHGIMAEDAVVVNANWWASELASYSNEDGCWNASTSCFSQLTTCYANAPPTGNTGCRAWEQKCENIQDACNANNFIGPPNAGKSLIVLPTSAYPIPAAANLAADQVYSERYSNSAISGRSPSGSDGVGSAVFRAVDYLKGLLWKRMSDTEAAELGLPASVVFVHAEGDQDFETDLTVFPGHLRTTTVTSLFQITTSGTFTLGTSIIAVTSNPATEHTASLIPTTANGMATMQQPPPVSSAMRSSTSVLTQQSISPVTTATMPVTLHSTSTIMTSSSATTSTSVVESSSSIPTTSKTDAVTSKSPTATAAIATQDAVTITILPGIDPATEKMSVKASQTSTVTHSSNARRAVPVRTVEYLKRSAKKLEVIESAVQRRKRDRRHLERFYRLLLE